MTRWKELISDALKETGDSWENVIDTTLTLEQLYGYFDDGYGKVEGTPFTLWTKTHVYFPCQHDGSEWVGAMARNPNNQPSRHVGG